MVPPRHRLNTVAPSDIEQTRHVSFLKHKLLSMFWGNARPENSIYSLVYISRGVVLINDKKNRGSGLSTCGQNAVFWQGA